MRKILQGGVAALLVVGGIPGFASTLEAQTTDPLVRPGIVLPSLPGSGSQIGASVRDLRADEQTDATAPSGGALVEAVRESGAAARAGLRAGDIVMEFDGERVRSAQQFARLVRETPPGRTVTARVVRDGAAQEIAITPDAAPGMSALPDIEREIARGLRAIPRDLDLGRDLPRLRSGARLGVTLMPLSDQLASYFGASGGVLVSAVVADSPAAQAGIQAGDVLVAVNGEAIASPADLAAAVRAAAPESMLELEIVRDRQSVTVTAKVPARPGVEREIATRRRV